MRILIFGGAGFIGGHLVDRLCNNDVTVVDNFSSGDYVNPKALYCRIDISNRKRMKEVISQVNPDIIFHLAANSNVPLSYQDPLLDFKSLEGTLNICENFKGRVIYLSSGFIYGNTVNRPCKETESFRLTSPYGITKITSEHYLNFYRNKGLSPIIVRPATVYGPRQKGGAMQDYIRRLRRGDQATIYGDKTRDYLYVSDLVDALISLMDISDFKLNVFNVGTGIETSLNDLYSMIARILNKRNEPLICHDRPGELQYFSLDSSRLQTITGWEPTVSLEKGLKLTCA